jgi:DNA-binding CsgD family transcriptional regulator
MGGTERPVIRAHVGDRKCLVGQGYFAFDSVWGSAMNGESYSELLDLIYESVVEPNLWVKVIERVADSVGGNSGWLSQLKITDGSGSGVLARIDPAAATRYLDYYGSVNPFTKFARLHDRSVPWTPRVMVDEEQFPREFLTRTEYYNDHMAPLDCNYALLIDLVAHGDEVVTVNISRATKRGQFDGQDIEFAETLLPHLIRALKLGGVFSDLRVLSDERAAALDRSNRGIFIVDRRCAVRHVNRLAECLIGRHDCLRIAAGKLIAINADATRSLYALVARAASIDPQVRSGGSMALPSSIGRPLSLTVAPLKRELVFTCEASALVCVTDLATELTISDDKLRALFGLTAAEARVARLLFEGGAPKDIAVKSQVSLNTIRVQLASIYAKTGTTGQSELLRLMMRIGDGPLNDIAN